MANTVYVASERLYLDDAGNVVSADDPTRRTLLVPAGGTLPQARAEALGLLTSDDDTVSDSGPATPAERATTPRRRRAAAR